MNDFRGKINSVFILLLLYMFCGAAFAEQKMTTGEKHKVSSGKAEKPSDPFLSPIKFYRDYISRVDGDRCPMQPTCSQYCKEAFKKHGPLLGWIMCSDRLMRCGRDEVKLSAPVWINAEKRIYDPVSNNDFWW
jgi:putative membrane protein insertion efficiency factor